MEHAASESPPLLRRAYLELADAEFDKAMSLFDQVLNDNPENAEAYMGQLLATYKLTTKDKLAACPDGWHESSLFQRVLRFSDDGDKAVLTQYAEAARINQILRDAKKILTTSANPAAAVALLEPLRGNAEADALYERCLKRQASIQRMYAEQSKDDETKKTQQANEARIKNAVKSAWGVVWYHVLFAVMALVYTHAFLLWLLQPGNRGVVPEQRITLFTTLHPQMPDEFIGLFFYSIGVVLLLVLLIITWTKVGKPALLRVLAFSIWGVPIIVLLTNIIAWVTVWRFEAPSQSHHGLGSSFTDFILKWRHWWRIDGVMGSCCCDGNRSVITFVMHYLARPTGIAFLLGIIPFVLVYLNVRRHHKNLSFLSALKFWKKIKTGDEAWQQ
jgi:hypothetical protein